MEDTDPINSPTQVKGQPVNLKRYDPDRPDPSTIYSGGRGNLKNPTLKKYPFAVQATGASPGYEVDLGKILENSLSRTHEAAKAELVRTMIEKGWGAIDRPGQQATIRGEQTREIPNVRPPKGTQPASATPSLPANVQGPLPNTPGPEAGPGQTSLYVHPRMYDDLRQALAPDQPGRIPYLSAALGSVTKGTLAGSTGEFFTHGKNVLTSWTRAGWHPADFVKNALGYMKGDTAVRDSIVELSRIGAMKEAGFESGSPVDWMGPKAQELWKSKWNPLAVPGKLLTALDRVQRLTLNDAFDRLTKRPDWAGGVEDTETARRDFINQIGQYNKRAQSKIVTMLRDTQIGPFATASTNYLARGVQSLGAGPGVSAKTWGGAASLRAEVLMKTLAPFAAAAVANYLAWGRVDGDDKTPLGGLKLGEHNGKTVYVDLGGAMTNLSRGLKATGGMAVLEGARAGTKPGDVATQVRDATGRAALSPAEGPAVNFLHTYLTGENLLGRQVSEKATGDESQGLNDLKAAGWSVNPTIATAAGKDEARKQPSEAWERLSKLMGPFGTKEQSSRPGTLFKSRGVKVGR